MPRRNNYWILVRKYLVAIKCLWPTCFVWSHEVYLRKSSWVLTNVSSSYCLRPKAKDMGITWVVVGLTPTTVLPPKFKSLLKYQYILLLNLYIYHFIYLSISISVYKSFNWYSIATNPGASVGLVLSRSLKGGLPTIANGIFVWTYHPMATGSNPQYCF